MLKHKKVSRYFLTGCGSIFEGKSLLNLQISMPFDAVLTQELTEDIQAGLGLLAQMSTQ